MDKYRIEFLYDNRKNKTNIYIWLGMSLKDSRETNGQLSKYTEDKIRKEIQLELIEKD